MPHAMPNVTPGPLRRSGAAKRTGVTIKALRHYEKRGLLHPRRTSAGWRLYDRADIERIERILAFKAMGFGLAQIAALLDAAPDTMAAALAAQELHLEARAKQVSEALDAVRDARVQGGGPRLALAA